MWQISEQPHLEKHRPLSTILIAISHLDPRMLQSLAL